MAIELGKSLVQPRLAYLTELVLPYKDCQIHVCCARGGMRSRSFTNFLAVNRFDVKQVIGGYRSFRLLLTHKLAAFFNSMSCIALGGLTGVGKTMLLHTLAQRAPFSSLDLEGCAQHRSSMFGGFGRQPRSQQQFESELLHWVWARERQGERPPIFVELEGKKIGNIHLPLPLRAMCDRGQAVLCTASMDTRVNRLVQEYWFPQDDHAAHAQMERILTHPHLLKKLGPAVVSQLSECLSKHRLHEFVYLLLKHYYDPLYSHSLRTAYDHTLDLEDIDQAADKLLELRTP